MQKYIRIHTGFCLITGIAVFVILPYCSKGDVQDRTSAPENENIIALHQAVATSFGLSPNKVAYNKSEKQFVVDDDGLVSLEDAQARFSPKGTAGVATGTTQKKYNYLVSSAKVSTIKIFADSTVPAAWVAVLDSAVMNWNGTGSKVYMRRIGTATGANTFITTNYSTSRTVASAAYPDKYGNAGRKVYINTYYNYLVETRKIFALTHELGHTLGLMHTDEEYGRQIPGTPLSDPYSVMNSVESPFTGFSEFDLAAIRNMYPR